MYKKIRKIISKGMEIMKRAIQKPPKLKFVYGWHYKHSKVNDHVVLFESFHGKDISDSPLYILYEFLKMEGANQYTIYFATNDSKRHQAFVDSIGLPVKLVDINTYKYTKILATAKYLVNNSSFPAYFIRKDEQEYLQTWHGTPLKTLGKKMRFGIESMYNVQHNFLQANHIMFPNEFTRDVMMEDYNLNSLYTGKVVMCGYPRNSIFMDASQAVKVQEKLENTEYTTLAYMPTWRGQSNHDIQTDSYGKEINAMLKELDDSLKDHQKLYVNFHPIVQKSVKLDNYKHVFPFPPDVDKYEFLNSVDALITDYSSVFFDFSVTRKPIILFMYDYEEYLCDRGMYFDIKELPFRKIYDLNDLKECIATEDFRKDDYRNDTEYIQKYIQYDSIDAGKKMAKLVFEGDEGDMPVLDYSENCKKERTVVFPEKINTVADMDSLVKTVDRDKEIVVFERRFFNPSMSSHLHDHYPDDFDYVFLTRTVPRTFLEQLLQSRNKKVQQELHMREIRRCFPGLSINPKFREEYYHGEPGETFCQKKISNAPCTAEVRDGMLQIKLKKKKSTPHKLLLVESGKKIVWTRELTEQECQQGEIREDFRSFLDEKLGRKNGRYQIALEMEDAKKGKKKLWFLSDKKAFQKAVEESDQLDQSAFYLDSISHKQSCFADGVIRDEIAILPYLNQLNEIFQIQVCLPEDVVDKYIQGKVLRLSTGRSVAKIKMKFKKRSAPVSDVVLAYRSPVEKREHSMEYSIRESGKHWIITASIDMSKIQLEELYWDVQVITKVHGREARLSPYLPRIMRLFLLLLNFQCEADKTHTIFAYRTKGSKLAFTYREKSPYDTMAVRFKEYAAFITYMVLLPYWKRKRLWLVFEKFSAMAQDNGYYFFKYCMEQLPKEKNSHIFFVLDKDSADWDKMKKYGKQVVEFMSFRHMLYCMVAKLYVGSDSKTHLYAWRTRPSLIHQRIAHHKILFLQHGVTALKRVDPLFGKKGSSPMTHFTTTSQFEQKIIVENFGYTEDDAPVLGFTRWDVLEDTSKEEERIILAMPTWRSWLEEKSPEEFVKSDYYRNYMNFLQNSKLASMLKENDVKLIFYIHPKFKDYLSQFTVSADNVELIPFGAEPLNEIMKKCSMLITDYSSVCWDVYYLGKPVLFYQFDCDTYLEMHGSYLDMEHELFGERYMECDQLIDGIGEYIQRGFKEKDVYGQMREEYFAYRDNDNSKRTYEYIISKEY